MNIDLYNKWAKESNLFTEEELSENKVVSDRWITGGIGGGSCLDEGDEDPHYSLNADAPLEFNRFDELLEKLIPDLSFFKYKKLKNVCVELKSDSDDEYYGNSTDYAYWECDLNKLYKELVSMELIK